MKKFNFLMMACSTLLAAGALSCSKDSGQHGGPGGGDEPTGTVTVHYGFDRSSSPSTYAVTALKPVTSWAKNVDDLYFIVADASGVIKDSRKLTVPDPDNGGNGQQAAQTLTNIVSGTNLQIWVVANLGQAVNVNELDLLGLKGVNMSSLLMQSQSATVLDGQKDDDFATSGETPMAPAPEIFAAVKTGQTINADADNDLGLFQMNRVVSLFRVLIDKDKNPNNASVDFTHAEASLRIRRVPSQVSFPDNGGAFSYLPAATDAAMTSGRLVTYVDGTSKVAGDTGFMTSEPASGEYSGTGTMLSGNFKTWRDVIIFPGGAADGEADASKKKFDVVVMGWAPEGYVAQGNTKVPAGGGLVAWSGAVNGKIAANGILEVCMTLSSAGSYIDPSDPVIPEPGSYGNVDITVQPMDWGNIVSTDMDL